MVCIQRGFFLLLSIFLPFFAHFLILLQTPFLFPSFPYPSCVSVFLPLTYIFSSISQSPFLLVSAFSPHSIFFLNILYSSFLHFLLYIFHFFFFLSFSFTPPLLSLFLFVLPSFIHFLCLLSSVQLSRFLSPK